jgi:endoglucanase
MRVASCTGLLSVGIVLAVTACGGSAPSSAPDGAAPPGSDAGADAPQGGFGGAASDGSGGSGQGGLAPDAGSPDGAAPDADARAPVGALHVAGGHLVDGAGHVVQLHGVDRSGTEWSCLYGSFFSGPSDQASLDAMKTWNVNAVRIPMNEDCWLDINGVTNGYGGKNYQDAIKAYVDLLIQNGMYVILDLHWAAPGTETANGQLGMADADHAPTFWSQVAAAYASYDDHVLFDLFNEPFISDWNCWLKGGTCAEDYNNQTYQAAGMAALLKAVRGAGADNVVMMGGLGYASDFSQWVSEVKSIPSLAAPFDGLTTDNIAVSWHTYSDQSIQTTCPTQYNNYDPNLTCASGAQTATNYGIPSVLAAGFPVVIGEVGIGAYSNSIAPYTTSQAQGLATWMDGVLNWMDQQNQSYLAWDWNTVAPPLLISDFNGTPTPYFGETYKAHLTSP